MTNHPDDLKEIPDVFCSSNELHKYDDYLKAYQFLQNMCRTLQEKIKWAIDSSDKSVDSYKLKKLYERVAGFNASELIERLRRLGYGMNKDFKAAFDRQGYRILELIRAGKRDQVFHAILRMYVSLQRPFPEVLLEPFKPHYSDELFKVFLFSFLSSILGKDEQQHEQNQSGRANEEQANEE
jgi:hypothetical protein